VGLGLIEVKEIERISQTGGTPENLSKSTLSRDSGTTLGLEETICWEVRLNSDRPPGVNGLRTAVREAVLVV